jgi:hypothetical protein
MIYFIFAIFASQSINSLIIIIGDEYNHNVDSFATPSAFIATIYMEEGYSEGTYIYVG